MADFIPIVTGPTSASLALAHYQGAKAFRVPLDVLPSISRYRLEPKWIDPGVYEVYDLEKKKDSDWKSWALNLPHAASFADPSFRSKPSSPKVNEFVNAILNQCAAHSPKWITIPQLRCKGTINNKLNRLLAEAAGKWKSTEYNSADLVYPIVLGSQEETNTKIKRNPRIEQAQKGYVDAAASGVWVVDETLNDDAGSHPFKTKRFPGLIRFHEELNAKIACPFRVAGPYWALHLALWARGLIDHPAVGIGGGFEYRFPGLGTTNPPVPKVLLTPLRRRIRVSRKTIEWLIESERKITPADPLSGLAFKQVAELAKRFEGATSQRNEWREQIAKEYRQWLNEIGNRPVAGRGMALFHHFTHAFAIGKQLRDLPEEADPPRRPEQVAEQYMTHCL